MKTEHLIVLVCEILFCSTAAAGVIRNEYGRLIPQDHQREPAFGVEFTLDHLISSVSLANGSTYGLARAHGGEKYQSLMRHYLNFCRQAYITQDPPRQEIRQAFGEGKEQEMERRRGLIRHFDSWWDNLAVLVFHEPEYLPAVFDGDEYAGDAEVDVLARAVGVLKSVMVTELDPRFNISDPFPWAYASIILPDFFWTHTKPKPDPDLQPDGLVSWIENFDHDTSWIKPVLGKFSAALYRNKFRNSEFSEWNELLLYSASTFSISLASERTQWYTREECCPRINHEIHSKVKACDPEKIYPTNILVDFNNATLSLGLNGPQADWTPWNTFPGLGGHTLNTHSSTQMDSTPHWDRVVENVHALCENIYSPDKVAADLILSGESWTEDLLSAFQVRLFDDSKARAIEIGDVVLQSDLFGATKDAARTGRYMLDTWVVCEV